VYKEIPVPVFVPVPGAPRPPTTCIAAEAPRWHPSSSPCARAAALTTNMPCASTETHGSLPLPLAPPQTSQKSTEIIKRDLTESNRNN